METLWLRKFLALTTVAALAACGSRSGDDVASLADHAEGESETLVYEPGWVDEGLMPLLREVTGSLDKIKDLIVDLDVPSGEDRESGDGEARHLEALDEIYEALDIFSLKLDLTREFIEETLANSPDNASGERRVVVARTDLEAILIRVRDVKEAAPLDIAKSVSVFASKSAFGTADLADYRELTKQIDAYGDEVRGILSDLEDLVASEQEVLGFVASLKEGHFKADESCKTEVTPTFNGEKLTNVAADLPSSCLCSGELTFECRYDQVCYETSDTSSCQLTVGGEESVILQNGEDQQSLNFYVPPPPEQTHRDVTIRVSGYIVGEEKLQDNQFDYTDPYQEWKSSCDDWYNGLARVAGISTWGDDAPRKSCGGYRRFKFDDAGTVHWGYESYSSMTIPLHLNPGQVLRRKTGPKITGDSYYGKHGAWNDWLSDCKSTARIYWRDNYVAVSCGRPSVSVGEYPDWFDMESRLTFWYIETID